MKCIDCTEYEKESEPPCRLKQCIYKNLKKPPKYNTIDNELEKRRKGKKK
jgi:hypothetical protein